MANFDLAFKKTVGLEGGYSDDTADPGGKTRYGITEATARANGYTGDIRALPFDTARQIYKHSYWGNLDACPSQLLAENIFDAAVNHGKGEAGEFLQKALNILNDQGSRWLDLAVDGGIGPVTLGVLKIAISKGFETDVIKVFILYRAKFFLGIAESNETQERFELGWLRNRVWLDVRK